MKKFSELVESVMNEGYVKNPNIYMYNNLASYEGKMGRLKRDLVISKGSNVNNPSGMTHLYELKKGDIINVSVARDGTTWICAGIFPSNTPGVWTYIVRGKPAERFSRDSEVEYMSIKTSEELEKARKIKFKEENYKGRKI